MKSSAAERRRRWLFRTSWLLLAAVAAGGILVAGARLTANDRPPTTRQRGESLVYMADDGTSSSFWLVDAGRPSTRVLIQSVPHAAGWSGQAAVAPDGNAIVYTRLSQSESDPDHAAELWLLRLADRRPVLLSEDVDLRSPLVWSSDSASIVYQRLDGQQAQLWRRRIDGGVPVIAASPAPGSVVIPFGYADDGDLLGALYDQSGTELVRLGNDGEQQQVQHLSDGTARDLVLSPDRRRVGFLFTDTSVNPPASRGAAVDLSTGSISILPSAWGEVVGIAWTPASVLVAGSAGSAAALRAESGKIVVPVKGSGFAQPLSWSSSGLYLAVRSFSGQSGQDPGSAAEMVLRTDGPAFELTTGQPVRFVGWLGASGPRRRQ